MPRKASLAGQLPGGRILAAPSWVIPGTLSENCAFLAGRVDEAGLLFFESAACLAYGDADLPPWLERLPLRYHVHLPADLPAEDGARSAAICHALMGKIDFLHPRTAVLHPPPAGPGAARHLTSFMREWEALGRSPSQISLENTRENDLRDLSAVVKEYDLQICLDMGHVLHYEQTSLVENIPLMSRVGMLHVNAPGKRGEHLSLTRLDPAAIAPARRICRLVPSAAVIMLELFDWIMLEESLPIAREWFSGGIYESAD